jgi:hypothetical protein
VTTKIVQQGKGPSVGVLAKRSCCLNCFIFLVDHFAELEFSIKPVLIYLFNLLHYNLFACHSAGVCLNLYLYVHHV